MSDLNTINTRLAESFKLLSGLKAEITMTDGGDLPDGLLNCRIRTKDMLLTPTSCLNLHGLSAYQLHCCWLGSGKAGAINVINVWNRLNRRQRVNNCYGCFASTECKKQECQYVFFMKESLENNMLQHMDVDSTTDDESLWILELMRYNREASGLHWSVQLSVSSPLLLHLKPAFAKQMQG